MSIIIQQHLKGKLRNLIAEATQNSIIFIKFYSFIQVQLYIY